MKLADILGYQLDMARCAALRSIHRLLGEGPYRPADTTALALVRERPGCNQTFLGRALAGNRSVGMKVASRLEARGLLTTTLLKGCFLCFGTDAVAHERVKRPNSAPQQRTLTAHPDSQFSQPRAASTSWATCHLAKANRASARASCRSIPGPGIGGDPAASQC